MGHRARNVAAVLLCLLWAAAWPSAVVRADETSAVPLYTNADLERFSVPPDTQVQSRTPTAEEWRFVLDYLERQYSRLDADRSYALERERTEADTEAIRRDNARREYALPAPWYWHRHGSRPPVGKRPTPRGNESPASALRQRLPAGEIRPLHAGPTRAQIDRLRATRRSGADAVPSPSRSTSDPRRAR